MNNTLKVTVRDCDAKADMAQVLAPGGILYRSQAPKNWTLDFNFGGPVKAIFTIDGGIPAQYWASPYCPAGHNAPLNLANGPHAIEISVNGAEIAPFVFTVADAPPVIPASALASNIGTNATGFDDPNNDPILHPILPATMNALGMNTIRLWLTGNIGDPIAPSRFAITRKWLALGFKVILVFNFQNQPGSARCKAPLPAAIATTLNSFPVLAGVSVEIGNEIDTTWEGEGQMPDDVYWIGTVAEYATVLANAYPILHQKGYAVIAANLLRSLSWYEQLEALGALASCDAIGVHFYQSTAAQCLSFIAALMVFAAKVGKAVVCTEGNIRNKTLATAITEIKSLLAGVAALAGIFLLFPLYNIADDALDACAPLTAVYAASDYYPAYT